MPAYAARKLGSPVIGGFAEKLGEIGKESQAMVSENRNRARIVTDSAGGVLCAESVFEKRAYLRQQTRLPGLDTACMRMYGE